jgi:hypothetical protein
MQTAAAVSSHLPFSLDLTCLPRSLPRSDPTASTGQDLIAPSMDRDASITQRAPAASKGNTAEEAMVAMMCKGVARLDAGSTLYWQQLAIECSY